jgi:hypothetical protein
VLSDKYLNRSTVTHAHAPRHAWSPEPLAEPLTEAREDPPESSQGSAATAAPPARRARRAAWTEPAQRRRNDKRTRQSYYRTEGCALGCERGRVRSDLALGGGGLLLPLAPPPPPLVARAARLQELVAGRLALEHLRSIWRFRDHF